MRGAERKAIKRPQTAGFQSSEVASYVATLSGELSALSLKNGLSTLAYLLEMARLEAESVARARPDSLGE